jgi:hypothetical protein
MLAANLTLIIIDQIGVSGLKSLSLGVIGVVILLGDDQRSTLYSAAETQKFLMIGLMSPLSLRKQENGLLNWLESYYSMVMIG